MEATIWGLVFGLERLEFRVQVLGFRVFGFGFGGFKV